MDTRDADLFQTAYGGLRRGLYPGSGYALPSAGTLQSVQRLTRGDLVSFYDRYYVPRNFVMVVVGDVDPQEAIATIRQDMDDFPAGRTGRRGDMPPDPPPMPTEDPAPVRLYQPDLAEVGGHGRLPRPAGHLRRLPGAARRQRPARRDEDLPPVHQPAGEAESGL